MKLSAYHYAVALRGLVAGTRYTLPMSCITTQFILKGDFRWLRTTWFP